MSSGEVPSPAVPESPFGDHARARGAVFGDVHGWSVALRHEREAPAQAAARSYAGLADLTTSGRIKVTGGDRIDLLQRISTNDLRPLESGRFVPTLFTTAKGRIVDRVLVYDRGDSLLLLTSPAGRTRIPDWIEKFIFSEDVRLTDVSLETSAFALSGPAAPALLRAICGVSAGAVRPGGYLALPIAGVETMVSSYDGLPEAWVFIAETPGILAVYEQALRAGEAGGLAPIGVEEAEVLRVEAGIPADGHELTEDWNPWEVGLVDSFSLTKGCYTGQEVIARLDTYEKVQRRLAGLRMREDVPLAVPQKVYARARDGGEGGEEREIGVLTSAVVSDRFRQTIGLAVLRLAFGGPGTEVSVGDARVPATVSDLPFG